MSKKKKIEDMFYDIKVTEPDKDQPSPRFGGSKVEDHQPKEGM